MSDALPATRLVRHGDTAWTLTAQHTGRTDLPLTDQGERQARELGVRLRGIQFDRILSSPLQRARRTAELAVPASRIEFDDDLMEWDYGALEGRTTAEIRSGMPDWTIWRGPWPDAETVDEVGARADRVIARIRASHADGDALVFAHGHLLRVLTARWIGLGPASGGLFELATATLSILG